MKKITSILLTLVMVISVCQNVVLAADTEEAISGEYTNVVAKNAMIYVDETIDNDAASVAAGTEDFKFRAYAFLGTGIGETHEQWNYVAIKWPPKIRTEDRKLNVENMATIDNETNTLYSKLSGVTYNLPENKNSGKEPGELISSEALVLDDFWRAVVSNVKATHMQNISAGEKFDKIHILVATTPGYDDQNEVIALQAPINEDYDAEYDTVGWTRSGAFWAYVEYADGTSALDDPSVSGNFKRHITDANRLHFKTKFLESEEADGRNGVIGRIIPNDAKITNEDRNGFLTELDSVISITTNATSAEAHKAEFTANPTSEDLIKRNSIYVYEYCIDVDETKELSKITFGNQYGLSRKGIAVLSVMGEKSDEEETTDEFTIKAVTEQEGEVYAAIYENDTKKLVATANQTANPSGVTEITVENSEIAADGEYDIKLFIWATDGSFKPLADAIN